MGPAAVMELPQLIIRPRAYLPAREDGVRDVRDVRELMVMGGSGRTGGFLQIHASLRKERIGKGHSWPHFVREAEELYRID